MHVTYEYMEALCRADSRHQNTDKPLISGIYSTATAAGPLIGVGIGSAFLQLFGDFYTVDYTEYGNFDAPSFSLWRGSKLP